MTWWYIKIGTFTGPGHGVPGMNGGGAGLGVGVGAGLGVGLAVGLAVGDGVGFGVAVIVGDAVGGDAPPRVGLQAMTRAVAAKASPPANPLAEP